MQADVACIDYWVKRSDKIELVRSRRYLIGPAKALPFRTDTVKFCGLPVTIL